MSQASKSSSAVRIREIRAVYDESTITVYQAYNNAIGSAAVEAQRLDASPLFRPSRMTWIKPSWNWMMYRAGYSYKDSNQSNILALKLQREFFEKLLLASVESHDEKAQRDGMQVRVQWDPERNSRTNKLDGDTIRSIQIGIPAKFKDEWLTSGIVDIQDVTAVAQELKKILDTDEQITDQELKAMGLLPDERIYPLSEHIREVLAI